MGDQLWRLTVDRQHPAGHGPIALKLRTSGSIIDEAIPVIYPMHRGAEKLFESRDYQQLLSLADRHDWLSSFGSELGLAMTVESMLGITVPLRAQWIRVALAELNRAIHHVRWLGESATEVSFSEDGIPDDARDMRELARDVRDQLIDLHTQATGARLHPTFVTYGGVRRELPTGWTHIMRQTVADIRPSLSQLATWWAGQKALDGVGVVSREQAVRYATCGPVARASGFAFDVRFNNPYLTYSELIAEGALELRTSNAGDTRSRFMIMAQELSDCLTCLVACSNRLEQDALAGPIGVNLPRTIRVPEGSGYGWTENPTGANGWYLVSRGAATPERLKLRTASFANAQALCQVLAGTNISDLSATILSFGLVAGDVAK